MKNILLFLSVLFFAAILTMPAKAQTDENFKTAVELLDKGDFTEAIPFLTKSIETNPNFDAPYYHRAFVYANMNKYELALNDISEVIRLKPENSAFKIIKGQYLVKLARYADAKPILEECLKSETTNSELYLMLAVCKKNLNEKDFCTSLQNAKKFGNEEAVELLKSWCD
jgi:predicted Zn-dependent protease